MEELQEIEKIKSLKASYFRLLDAKDWEALAACLTEDITFDYPPGNIHLGNRQELIANFSKRHATTTTAHTGSMPDIRITNNDQAEGIWFMTDYIILTDENQNQTITQGFGRYFEKYVRIDDKWLIQSIRLERSIIVNPQAKVLLP